MKKGNLWFVQPVCPSEHKVGKGACRHGATCQGI